MVTANVRIAKEDYNIRLVTGPDRGIKGIGGPKKFFHFHYTKTCKKYEILTISHIPVISQWSITCTIPLTSKELKKQKIIKIN